MKIGKIFESPRAAMMEIFHQDGIIDLIAGAVLLNFGFDLLNKSTMTSLFTYIPILLMTPMKMQMTIARLGYEPFNNNQKQVRQWMTIAAAGMVLTLLLLGFFTLDSSSTLSISLAETLGANSRIIGAAILLFVVSVVSALLIPIKRFLIYAAATLLVSVISIIFSLPVHTMIFALSILMMALGIRLMFKFSRAYPQEKPAGKKKS